MMGPTSFGFGDKPANSVRQASKALMHDRTVAFTTSIRAVDGNRGASEGQWPPRYV